MPLLTQSLFAPFKLAWSTVDYVTSRTNLHGILTRFQRVYLVNTGLKKLPSSRRSALRASATPIARRGANQSLIIDESPVIHSLGGGGSHTNFQVDGILWSNAGTNLAETSQTGIEPPPSNPPGRRSGRIANRILEEREAIAREFKKLMEAARMIDPIYAPGILISIRDALYLWEPTASDTESDMDEEA